MSEFKPAELKSLPKFGEPMWKNAGEKTAVSTVLRLINETQKELMIVTDLLPVFFSKNEINESLENAISRNVQIKIVSDRKNALKDNKNIEKWVKNKLIEYKEVPKVPRHLMVGDKRHVRLEKEHEYGTADVVGLVDLNNPFLGRQWTKAFNGIWVKYASASPSK